MRMPTSSELYFSNLIQTCRSSFERSRSGFLHRLGLRKPPTGCEDCDPGKLSPHYEKLAAKGRVVWGALTQANYQIYTPGKQDLPGVIVYSTDPYYDAHPQDLSETAAGCFDLKNTIPADSEFRAIAQRISDELDPTARMMIPLRLSDDRDAFLGPMMFHRSRLPGGVLNARVFPILIAPVVTEITMLLPLRYWPTSILTNLKEFSAYLHESPITSQAVRVAKNAVKRPCEKFVPDWDVSTTPVSITAAAAAEIRTLRKKIDANTPLTLYLALLPNGNNDLQFVSEHNSQTDDFFISNGIEMAIPKAQRQRLSGTRVDYKTSVFQSGFTIYVPD